jgi:hypothetical protein
MRDTLLLSDEERRVLAEVSRRDFADMLKAMGQAIALQLAEPTWPHLKNVQARAAALLRWRRSERKSLRGRRILKLQRED